jgi:hypothetical protein
MEIIIIPKGGKRYGYTIWLGYGRRPWLTPGRSWYLLLGAPLHPRENMEKEIKKP